MSYEPFYYELRAMSHELLLGSSPAIKEVKAIIERVADTDVTVLIRGESGTGKGLVARSVHACSARNEGPFVNVNCAAIPGDLLESELFGCEAGAYTGALRARPGKFSLARGGTIFLDDIGGLGLPLQAKLLEVLQDGRFSPLGGSEVRVDVRVIVSAHSDLQERVVQGSFRVDLYYRLDVVSISLPPLRKRREDIPLLVEHFARHYGELYRRRVPRFSATALRCFETHGWPGNVRELENAVKRAVILGNEEAVAREIAARKEKNGHRTWPEASSGNGAGLRNGKAPLSLKEIAQRAARQAEKAAIREALDGTGWNRREAARLLHVSYKALLYKIKDCGVKADSS